MALHPKKVNQKILNNPKLAKLIKIKKESLPVTPTVEIRLGTWFDIDSRSPELENKAKKKVKKDSQ